MTNKKTKLRLFVVNYSITTPESDFRGVAVVKAATTSQAQGTFLNQSNFNGYQKDIKVSRIQEIFLTPEPALLCEEYVKHGLDEDK